MAGGGKAGGGAAGEGEGPDRSSPLTSAIFIFNIIVGTGALALPKIFSEAGLVLASVFLVLVGGLSYMTAWMLAEAQGVCTVLEQATSARSLEDFSKLDAKDVPFVAQIASMFSMLMPRWGPAVWYVVVIIYLITDLSVYAVFIPDTFSRVIPGIPALGLDRDGVYYFTLLVLAVLVTPLVFFSLKKTLLIQIVTSVTRHLIFWIVIIAACMQFAHSHATLGPPGPGQSQIILAHPSGLALLFGGATYAYICQQYIPQMLAPINRRRSIGGTLAVVFSVILAYYLVICWTAVFGFYGTPEPEGGCTAESTDPCPLQESYSFNFGYLQPHFFGWFVVLGPLLSLFSSMPILAITLRDNIIILYWYLTAADAIPSADVVTQRASPILSAITCGFCSRAACSRSHITAPAAPIDSSASPDMGASPDSAYHMTTSTSHAINTSRGDDVLGDEEASALRALVSEVAKEARETRSPPGSTAGSPLALRVVFGLVAILPPFVVALATKNVDILVGVAGGFGGAVIMMVFPVLLVLFARRVMRRLRRILLHERNGDSLFEGVPWLSGVGRRKSEHRPMLLGLETGAAGMGGARADEFRATAWATVERVVAGSAFPLQHPLWGAVPVLFAITAWGFNVYNLAIGQT